MGMCKSCGEVFSSNDMIGGYCQNCLTDEIKAKIELDNQLEKELIIRKLKRNKKIRSFFLWLVIALFIYLISSIFFKPVAKVTIADYNGSSYLDYNRAVMKKNVDQYPENEKLWFYARVTQIIDDGEKLRLDVVYDGNFLEGYSGGNLVCEVKEQPKEKWKIDQLVKVYGRYDGLITYTSLLGEEKIVPLIEADFIDKMKFTIGGYEINN